MIRFNLKMNQWQKRVVIVLTAVCITGAFGIPLGDPKFLIQAFALEFSFIALTIITLKKIQYTFIPNFIIATVVIIGNTASPKHIEIMSTLHPLYNAIVLIIGGYILQALLVVSNAISYKNHKKITSNSKTS